jgi:isoquinoline 1-oxidoreductase subunit beta
VRANRRTFLAGGLKAAAAAGLAANAGFVLSIDALPTEEHSTFSPNAYLQITPDSVVHIWVTRSEMGQGVRTTLPMILADELDVDWALVRLEQAATLPRFKGIRLRTSGSGSTEGTYPLLRKAGATARAMLIAAAAERWGVEPAECLAEAGLVKHSATGRELSYGSLVEAASRQEIPNHPPLKDPKNFRFIGKPMKRADGAAIVSGRAIYGLDMRVPGMVYATVRRCPYIGGELEGFDAKKTLQLGNVLHVMPVTTGIRGGVAVIANNTWAAMRGADALEVIWNPGPNRDFDSDSFLEDMEAALGDAQGYFVRDDGDADAALSQATRRIDAIYQSPFQVHAPLETMNCTASVSGDRCEIWVPTQTPETAQAQTAKLLNLPLDSVKVNVTLLGGGFGRRLFADYVPEAVEISRSIGKPVQVVWTRADDMRFGFFHPPDVVRITGGLDRAGNPVAWKQRSIGCDLSMFGFPSEKELSNPRHYFEGNDPWGSFDNPYNFPNLKADFVRRNSPVPTGPWRAVGYPGQVFARESFIDELAHVGGRDPLELRIEMLKPGNLLAIGDQKIDRQRLIHVLEVAAEKASWKSTPVTLTGRDWGRGVACNVYDQDCFIAQIAEVSVSKSAHDVRVHRIVSVVDCGRVINPLGIEGQAESGITWALTATLHGRMDFKKGIAVQENFTSYEVLRMNEAPVVETYIVPSENPPGGFGETAVPAVAPAVANAIFAATGKRIRTLPITSKKLVG